MSSQVNIGRTVNCELSCAGHGAGPGCACAVCACAACCEKTTTTIGRECGFGWGLYDYDFLFNFTISYQSRGPWININSRTLVSLSHKARCPMQFIIYMKVLTEVEMWCGAWSCDMSYVMCVVRVRCVRTAASRFALAFGLQ